MSQRAKRRELTAAIPLEAAAQEALDEAWRTVLDAAAGRGSYVRFRAALRRIVNTLSDPSEEVLEVDADA